MNTLSITSTLERLMNDSRVRIGAAIVGALVIGTSMIVVNVSQRPVRSAKTVAVLPEYPLNIPMVRQLPPPQPKKGEVVQRLGKETKVRPSARTLTARR